MYDPGVSTGVDISGFFYGVDDYISKPFDLDELLVRVESVLGGCDRDCRRGRGGTLT